MFTEKRECSDLFAIAENKYRTEVSLYKDKKIVQEAGLEPARYCYQAPEACASANSAIPAQLLL